ncbi:KOW domain-containing RNA-binding protein [Bacillus atrophaeus]|uniref:KOW domain-containing RNA-binding protein n=1 Tax=Bacillus atrophaeus TaxID=1452 RepID=UPI0022805D45|nr:KOW domain-containing RNA-binding protein [Bacillus atrophaeus]MCY8515448.1 KOW domain-containing RNA-binding protein [Bacillus atrophaeus]MCY8993931.1 KOW domain-containing RNA-binding protein [Bacillus atrophaeus]
MVPKTVVFPPEVGQIVRIKQGRETNQLAVVIRIVDHHHVLIADGEKRTFHSPKKKNINHLTLYDCVSPEVQNSINETGRVTNGKLRFSLLKFVREQVTDLKKGEHLNGERRCN